MSPTLLPEPAKKAVLDAALKLVCHLLVLEEARLADYVATFPQGDPRWLQQKLHVLRNMEAHLMGDTALPPETRAHAEAQFGRSGHVFRRISVTAHEVILSGGEVVGDGAATAEVRQPFQIVWNAKSGVSGLELLAQWEAAYSLVSAPDGPVVWQGRECRS